MVLLLISHQSCFPKGRSHPVNLLEFFERVSKILGKGESVELTSSEMQGPLINVFTRG